MNYDIIPCLFSLTYSVNGNKINLWKNCYVHKLFKKKSCEPIYRKDLIKNVSSGGKCTWMFNTVQLRQRFRELFDRDMNNDDSDCS